ncbi:MAG: AIR carboxylase family protein [Deinococcales bacterium]
MMKDVYILMGSKADMPHVEKIAASLSSFGLSYQIAIASAHKSVDHLLKLVRNIEASPHTKVYISVAGRSNALSGLLDCNVTAPVIACPPYSDAFGGADIFSSMRMPSGVAPALVLEPANAALFAAKILGKGAEVKAFQEQQSQKLIDDHASIQ